MDDILTVFETPHLQLRLEIEDMGDRLDDYEPYWQWSANVLIRNSDTFLEYSSPRHGYYLSERAETIEDAYHFLRQQSPTTLYQEEWSELLEGLWDKYVN